MLWCLAIRHAILTGELDARIGLQHIDKDRRDLWVSRLDVAEASKPSDFNNNGWVVDALQGAWSAISITPVPHDDPAVGVFRADHLRLSLDAAVRGGYDTDTVAAIRGRVARRGLWRISGTSDLAPDAAWLAGFANSRLGGTGNSNRERGRVL